MVYVNFLAPLWCFITCQFPYLPVWVSEALVFLIMFDFWVVWLFQLQNGIHWNPERKVWNPCPENPFPSGSCHWSRALGTLKSWEAQSQRRFVFFLQLALSPLISSELTVICPGWCGSVDWALACKPKGHWFNSQSGHMPGLQARSPVGGVREATTRGCFSPSLSPSLPLSLKINKILPAN